MPSPKHLAPALALLATITSTLHAADNSTSIDTLPIIKQMPDPLTLLDGTKVTTPAQWQQRREEMKKLLEDYEYGHMPPPPGNVTAHELANKLLPDHKTNYRLLHLTFGPNASLGFDLAIFTPLPTATQKQSAPYPTIISLAFSTSESAAPRYQLALDRGYAVVTIPYQQLGADNPNYKKSAFFPAYPDYDWNDIAAWAWGISRAVDFLQTDPATDKTKLIATGVSRNAQAVLLAGAFDQRISLIAPVGGGMALRFSGKSRGGGQGIDEIVDQNTFWFGPRFPEFKGHTDQLPTDQHFLLALAAPRPFILCNALSDQYGTPNAATQTYLAAQPVYALLHAPENLALNFRPGQHGMIALDWTALLDFADLHLRNIPTTRPFHQLPENP
jgi:hypothetical protein